MGHEWQAALLGDVIELKRGYDLPQPARYPGIVPVVSSSGITDYHSAAMVKGPGVVTGRYGTLGEVFYIENDFWPLNTTLYVRDFKGNDPRFISYFLRGLDFLAYSDKAAVPGLNRNHLHQARIRFPTDLGEQREIARILGTFDDKLELNGHMTETLEAMMGALFKSWFMNFAPVRAKAEGRDPGIPKHIAELFPARLVESELGEVPEGWRVRPLNEVLTESNERVADANVPTYSSTNGGLELRSGRFSKTLAASDAKNKLVREGSFVFGLSRRVLNFGLMRDQIGSVSAAYRVFAVDQTSIRSDLLERLIRMNPNYFYNAVSASSREGQSVSSEGLGLLEFVQPSAAVQDAFYRVTASLRSRALLLGEQSRTLTALRNTLLPKLISGERRVRGTETRLASGHT